MTSLSALSYSSSSSSKAIKENLEVAKTVGNRYIDDNQLIERYQKRIDELLHFKEENIALKSQLKIAHESLSLQEAEFAFIRGQMEDELKKLRDNEKCLSNALSANTTEKANNPQRFEVEARIQQEREKEKRLENKVMKDKFKKKQLKSRIAELEGKITDLDETINVLRAENMNVKNECKITADKLFKERENTKNLTENQTKIINSNNQANNMIESLQSENIDLKRQLENAKNQNYDYETQLKNLKNTLKTNEMSNLGQIESLKQNLTLLKRQNEELEMELKRVTLELNHQKMKNADLEMEHNIHAGTTERISKLEFENSQLKSQLQSQQNRIEQNDSLQLELAKIRNVIDHVTFEYSSLANIFKIQNDNINERWVNLSKACLEAVQAQKVFHQIQAQNDQLKERVKSLIQSTPVISETNKNLNPYDDDKYITGLKTSLKHALESSSTFEKKIEFMKYQQNFVSQIEMTNALLLKNLNNIYNSIYDDDSGIRSVIFSVIFGLRIASFAGSQAYVTHSASNLTCFNSRAHLSPEIKLQRIGNKLNSLAQDLIQAKTELISLQNENMQLRDENASAIAESQSFKTENEINKNKSKALKERMIELQQELSILISPEDYANVLEFMKKMQQKFEENNSRIQSMENEIRQYKKYIHKLNLKVTEKTTIADENESYIADVRDQVTEKEDEIHALKALLTEKTKEIIALERENERQKQLGKAAVLAYSNLKLGEECKVKLNSTLESATFGSKDHQIDIKINPAFLG